MSEKIEEIREKKLRELQQQSAQSQQATKQKEQIEQQKQILLKKILTPKARQRLINLKMVKPEFISQLELQIIQLVQMGRLPIPLKDEDMKQMLIKLQSQKREPKIRRV
jgi:programmed cell death protein 5